MTVSALDQKTVQLMADQMIMKSKTTLTQYEMTKWSLEKTEKGISMIIVFKRMVTSELLTTYMPSLLLIFTTYATTFFKPFYFEAAVTVNLTTMLVMTTIFISKMESLPPTSDIKMIDVWLILCQLVPFIEAVMLTAIEYHRETDHVDLVNPGSRTRRANSKLFGKLSQKLEIVGGITFCSLHIFNFNFHCCWFFKYSKFDIFRGEGYPCSGSY